MGFVIRRDSNKATLCTTYIILAEALAFDVNFYKQNLHLFITCQNYHFGKYVGWSCLSVCYLPKFTFWQVCSLVVFVTCQNLILASMFVGRVCLSVCYLPKFTFWQVCSLVVFVCLFVQKFHKISRTTQSIITKLGHKQALVHDSCKFVGQ